MADRLDVTSEAADWYARLRSGNTSELEAARFRVWIAAHPSHRHEFEALDALWNDLATLEQSTEVAAEIRARTRERSRLKVYRRPMFAVAASLVVVLGIGFFGLVASNRAQIYRTAIGEQRIVPLADGSIVILNTSTEVRVPAFGEQRRIELLTGQANFDVAKDPKRPFIVMAGHGEVRALGTKFDVYKTDDTVVVTLLEGTVSVLPDVRPESQATATSDPQPTTLPVMLRAGERVAFAERSSTLPLTIEGATQVERADILRASAWTKRKLDFDDTPLVEAIAEANRYSSVRIELRAPSLANVRISGVFEAGKNAAFAQALRAHLGLVVQQVDKDRIVLTPP